MLRAGQVVDGRWRVVTQLSAGDELLRWFGREQSGRLVELLRPRPGVPLRRRRALVAGFRAAIGEPAALPILHVSERGLIARELPGERSLEALDGPLPPERAAALAGWLGPAVLAMAPVLAGRLERSDVVLSGGRPLLAPGRRRGGTGPERSALGALGALLYELLSQRRPADPPQPIGQLVPGLPPEVEALVTGLLSPDPVTARGALPERPPAPPELAPEAPEVARRAASDAGAEPLSASRPPFAVLVQPGGLGPVGRRRFSEALGVPELLIAHFADRGLPLPIASATSREDAAIWSEELAALRVPAAVVDRRGGFDTAWLSQAAPLVFGSALAAALGIPGLAAAALAGAGALLAWRAGREVRERRAVARAYEVLEAYEDRAPEASVSDLLASAPASVFSRELSSTTRPGGREQIRSALRAALLDRRE